MKKNIKLHIGLLAMVAFLGACGSLGPASVKDIPASYFEENRGEGERLVYITVNKAADVEGHGGSLNLYIVTDDTTIAGLTDPYTSISAGVGAMKKISPSVQNSISLYRMASLAVFSLPKTQEKIGLAYFCSVPDESKNAATGVTGVSVNTEMISSTGHRTLTIDPTDGDIAIKVLLRPSGNETFQALTTTDDGGIKQTLSESQWYGGSVNGTGTPGFIAPPVKDKK